MSTIFRNIKKQFQCSSPSGILSAIRKGSIRSRVNICDADDRSDLLASCKTSLRIGTG